jgi:hypothetical protein
LDFADEKSCRIILVRPGNSHIAEYMGGWSGFMKTRLKGRAIRGIRFRQHNDRADKQHFRNQRPAEQIWIGKPHFGRLKHCLMLPSADPPIVARGTLQADRTTHACRCPLATDLLSSFLSSKSADQPFASRAFKFIVASDTAKLIAIELPFARLARGAGFAAIYSADADISTNSVYIY